MKSDEALRESKSGKIKLTNRYATYYAALEGDRLIWYYAGGIKNVRDVDVSFSLILRTDWQPYEDKKECECVWCGIRTKDYETTGILLQDRPIPLLLKELCKRDKGEK